MKKTTKGALSAAAAGTLLLGGAGSFAFWHSSAIIGATSLTSGHLTLSAANCGAWQLDGDSGNLGTRKLVPGDSLTRTCTFDLKASGAHLNATVNVKAPNWTGDLADGLTTDTKFTIDNNATTSIPTTGAYVAVDEGDHVVTAVFTATFDDTTELMDKVAQLDAMTLYVQQTTPHAPATTNAPTPAA